MSAVNLASDSKSLAIHLTVSDAVDGATRLLCDAQRFGLAIRSVHIDALDNGNASVHMNLSVQAQTDTAQLCSRFARHVGVLSVEPR
jgi:hypothetical protein